MTTYRLSDWPVWELLCVAEVAKVVNVTKQLVLQLRVLHHWHCAILQEEGAWFNIRHFIGYLCHVTDLVRGPGVAKETRGEVGDVTGNFLDHELPHLTVPNGLGCVKLTKKGLTEFLSS